jgi:MFS family permease
MATGLQNGGPLPPEAKTGTLRVPNRASVTRGFSSLKVRNYRLFWISQVISLSGTWMQSTAQAWLVLQLSRSALALGIVTTLQFLPITLLSLYGGVLADRLPKRQTLVVTQTLLLVQAAIFGLLVATGVIQIWHIYVLAVIQGTITAIDNPVRQAFVVEMVGRDELLNAVALNSMSFNAARIVGPSLAGVVIARIGIPLTLFLNALSFVPVVASLLMMNPAELHPASGSRKGSAAQQLIEGLRYSRRTPQVLLILIIIGAIGTFGYNFTIVLPLLADFVLHTDAQGFGLLSSFLGLGSLIGAVLTAYTKDVTMRRLFVGSTAFGILFAAVALSQIFAVSAALLIALGFAGIIFSTTSNTLLQLIVPDELRGRVMSLNVLLFLGSTPVGGLLIGILSNALSVQVALLVCAALCLAGVGIAAAYKRATLDGAAKPTSADQQLQS